jgi:hypothetical protein
MIPTPTDENIAPAQPAEKRTDQMISSIKHPPPAATKLNFNALIFSYWILNQTMVSLPDVQSSNDQIAKLPAGLVAVFVGATNGIGEATLKEFARSAKSPRAYFVGRSQEAGNRITAECRQLNPEGEYLFIKADLSLIRNVDEVCREIKSKEKAINLLFLSCGSARYGFGKYKYYL